jgi:hypothetical protein
LDPRLVIAVERPSVEVHIGAKEDRPTFGPGIDDEDYTQITGKLHLMHDLRYSVRYSAPASSAAPRDSSA